jgi:hypothetical protein
VAVPERLGLDVLAAYGAHELAGVGVRGMWVFYTAGGPLLAQEGAHVGHGGRIGWVGLGAVGCNVESGE